MKKRLVAIFEWLFLVKTFTLFTFNDYFCLLLAMMLQWIYWQQKMQQLNAIHCTFIFSKSINLVAWHFHGTFYSSSSGYQIDIKERQSDWCNRKNINRCNHDTLQVIMSKLTMIKIWKNRWNLTFRMCSFWGHFPKK